MFYGHIYTIVTVHSIKDCQLSRSTVTSFLLNILGHYTIVHYNNHLYSLHKKTYKAQCIKLPICMHNKWNRTFSLKTQNVT